MYADAREGQKRGLGPLELEFQAIVRYLMWVLGTKLLSSSRAARVPDWQAISLAPPPPYFEVLLAYSVGKLIVQYWLNFQVPWIKLGLAIILLNGMIFNLDASLLDSEFCLGVVRVGRGRFQRGEGAVGLCWMQGRVLTLDKKLAHPWLCLDSYLEIYFSVAMYRKHAFISNNRIDLS